ncbi:MAG TPA: ABC transporter permease [Sphingobacteriaceae bacterium]|nr:ABC transporter permease [Sphingobacteriaceae bacterium]
MAVEMSSSENFKVALQSISSNRLRTFLTALIIAIGITALVGILTSIDAMQRSLTESFSAMGSNSFSIRNRGMNIRIGGQGTQPKTYPKITYQDAVAFKREFQFPAIVSVTVGVTNGATAKFKSETTNPNIGISGSDENYLQTSGLNLGLGRNFSDRELELGSNVALIGSSIQTTLFKNNEDPVGQAVTVGGTRFTVIGVLESKGSSAAFGGDNTIVIPLEKARSLIPGSLPSYIITVMGTQPHLVDATVGEATATFRKIRKLGAIDDNNFEITKSDAIAQTLMENLKYVTIGAVVIGLITLIGASIGLMNIMLVSVTERTREIGLRKAIGASPSVIRRQFLTEAIVICLMGGVAGILLGLIIGNGVAILLGASFIIPWLWMALGIIVCVMVGVISGFYPASKASLLDPVEALRYE